VVGIIDSSSSSVSGRW